MIKIKKRIPSCKGPQSCFTVVLYVFPETARIVHGAPAATYQWLTTNDGGADKSRYSALGFWEWQAEHLAEAWCLHLHPINAIFYGRPSPYGRLSFLGKGFVLRCFQDLS